MPGLANPPTEPLPQNLLVYSVPLSFDCPQCGKHYENVSDKYAGKRMQCKCGKVMRLGPKPSIPTPPPIAEKKTRPKPAPASPQPVPPPSRRTKKPTPAPTAITPITPVAPVQQPAPISEMADPIFGSGQKISAVPTPVPSNTGPNDLFESIETNSYQAAYAPPAPIPRHQPQPRQVRRHGASGKSVAGPVMSIISGSLGIIYGLIITFFYVADISRFITIFSAMNAQIPLGILFAGIIAIIGLMIALTLTGSCGYSAIYGILELSNDVRNSRPSKLAGIACLIFIIFNILLFLLAIAGLYVMKEKIGDLRFNQPGTMEIIMTLVLGFIVALIILAIPIFVFFVGVFRKK